MDPPWNDPVSCLLRAEDRATVPAGVVECSKLALEVPDHHDVLTSDREGLIVPGIRYFVRAAHGHPHVVVEHFELTLVVIRVVEVLSRETLFRRFKTPEVAVTGGLHFFSFAYLVAEYLTVHDRCSPDGTCDIVVVKRSQVNRNGRAAPVGTIAGLLRPPPMFLDISYWPAVVKQFRTWGCWCHTAIGRTIIDKLSV